jgi:hypothetical protein
MTELDVERRPGLTTDLCRRAVQEEFNHEKQALLTDFEARRKELESHQKSEQDRQERMLQELLEMKKKKRQDKLGLDKQGAS